MDDAATLSEVVQDFDDSNSDMEDTSEFNVSDHDYGVHNYSQGCSIIAVLIMTFKSTGFNSNCSYVGIMTGVIRARVVCGHALYG